MAGISFVNYADFCTINNLRLIAGAGSVSVVSGSLASLKTRQMSDAVRIKWSKTGAQTSGAISFDVVRPSPPSPFGELSSQQDMFSLGAFVVAGFRPVATTAGTAYPAMDARAVLRGYTSTTTPGNSTSSGDYVSAVSLFSSYAIQDASDVTQNILLPQPDAVRAASYAFTELFVSDFAASTVAMPWPSAPWAYPTQASIQSLRVDLYFTGLNAAPGDVVFDIGRLWIGPSLRFSNGATPSIVMSDPSAVITSRDGQVYSTEFSRVRTMTLSCPALTELEAIGTGPTPRIASAGDGRAVTANNMVQAMYSCGTSRQIVAWAGSRPPKIPVGGVDWANYARTCVIGRPSQWAPIAPLQARRATVAGKSGTGRLYSGGLTVQEER